MRRRSYIMIIIALLICISIYGLCRPNDVLMRQVFALFISEQGLEFIRLELTELLPQWFIYSLPGALWCFSAVLSVLIGSKSISSNRRSLLCVSIIAIPFVMEWLQYVHVTDGTFDLVDLQFFFLGSVAAALYYLLWSKENEESDHAIVGWRWAAAFFISILVFGNQWSL